MRCLNNLLIDTDVPKNSLEFEYIEALLGHLELCLEQKQELYIYQLLKLLIITSPQDKLHQRVIATATKTAVNILCKPPNFKPLS